jgi:hypothetical protein
MLHSARQDRPVLCRRIEQCGALETINSMYRWYQKAEVCFVYLPDLAVDAKVDEALPHWIWVMRGWTLQRLRAPFEVFFYDSHWRLQGLKYEWSRMLNRITSIEQSILLHEQPLRTLPVAKKMS